MDEEAVEFVGTWPELCGAKTCVLSATVFPSKYRITSTRIHMRTFLRSFSFFDFFLTAWHGQSWQQLRFSMFSGAHGGSSGCCMGSMSGSGSLSVTRARMSKNSFPIRDLRVDGAMLGREWASISLLSFRIGVDERTVLALVQEEWFREGTGGSDSSDTVENREPSVG